MSSWNRKKEFNCYKTRSHKLAKMSITGSNLLVTNLNQPDAICNRTE